MKIAPKDERPFPIQGGQSFRQENGKVIYSQQSFIPWWLAEIAYEDYASRYGTDQSLQTIADRGGFGREELIYHLRSPK